MSVSGLLSTMNLPEILQWLKFSQKTGTLVFDRKGMVKKVFVENGMIVSASSNDPKEYLGQILICFGDLTEDQLKRAFEIQATSKTMLGRVLVEHFKLSESQIARALKIKIEETIYDVFLWQDGKFIFNTEVSEMASHDRLRSVLSMDEVIFEGARRADEWKEFKTSFPSVDTVFKRLVEQLSVEELKSNFFVERIFSSVDGEKSIQRILLETRAPEYRGIEAFAKLYWAKLIAPNKKVAAPEVAVPADPASRLKQAVDLFKGREIEKAYDLIETLVLEDPQNAEGQTLFKVVQEAYLAKLQSSCPLTAVPMISVDLSILSEKIYTSLEGFLASRINGHWDIRSLLMISPVPELESLRILKRFLDEGLIRFKS